MNTKSLLYMIYNISYKIYVISEVNMTQLLVSFDVEVKTADKLWAGTDDTVRI